MLLIVPLYQGCFINATVSSRTYPQFYGIIDLMSNEYLLLFGKRVRELRKAKKLSQLQLADKVGVDRSYIGLLERGERNPSLEVIADIAKALGTKPDILLK